MNKNLTEVVFILDRSGSMGGLEADTIGGYNSMLKKQQEEEGDVVISTVLFDDRSEVIHDRKHLMEVKFDEFLPDFIYAPLRKGETDGALTVTVGKETYTLPLSDRPASSSAASARLLRSSAGISG